MRKFINITNHSLSPAQLEEVEKFFSVVCGGEEYRVVELPEELKSAWGSLSPETISATVSAINRWLEQSLLMDSDLCLVQGHQAAVVALLAGLSPEQCFFAHSERRSIEEAQPDGSILKKSLFEHKGFYNYYTFKKLGE